MSVIHSAGGRRGVAAGLTLAFRSDLSCTCDPLHGLRDGGAGCSKTNSLSSWSSTSSPVIPIASPSGQKGNKCLPSSCSSSSDDEEKGRDRRWKEYSSKEPIVHSFAGQTMKRKNPRTKEVEEVVLMFPLTRLTDDAKPCLELEKRRRRRRSDCPGAEEDAKVDQLTIPSLGRKSAVESVHCVQEFISLDVTLS